MQLITSEIPQKNWKNFRRILTTLCLFRFFAQKIFFDLWGFFSPEPDFRRRKLYAEYRRPLSGIARSAY